MLCLRGGLPPFFDSQREVIFFNKMLFCVFLWIRAFSSIYSRPAMFLDLELFARKLGILTTLFAGVTFTTGRVLASSDSEVSDDTQSSEDKDTSSENDFGDPIFFFICMYAGGTFQ
eukprot:TRINITY_DN796_c1_g2_i1.p1 TRINITY_DN796_c1_g2~~TRINITY_DN796_c1_g2_i1.p1  ORF type:complete len:116 (-),score=10.42 TRINITY_DN796_c1_g2_i1:16-363(-)